MTDELMVGSDQPVEAPQGAPNVEGAVVESTPAPSQPLPDADGVSQLRAEMEAQIAQRENDIRRIKSASDSRFAQESKQWREREQTLQQQLDELRMKTLPEDQRRTYSEQISSRRNQEIQTQLDALARERDEAKNSLAAQNFFMQQGVPPQKLVTDQGYDELWRSGLFYMQDELNRLRRLAQPSPTPQTPNPAPAKRPPEAPAVNTATSAPAFSPGWPDLIKRYGSMEEVFRLVETRQLDPSVIPVRKG